MNRLISSLMVFLAAAGLATAGWEANARTPNTSPSGAADGKGLVEQSRFTIAAAEMNGIRIAELSGLAWDDDEQLLYAVSDQGSVVHFRLKLDGNRIVACEPVYAARLAEQEDSGSRRKGFDAEGLALVNANNGRSGDTELVVVTERQPRFIRFSPAGTMLGESAAPAPLDDRRSYRGSKGLESLAHHAKHGLLTAPESPLKEQAEDKHTIYASGRRWSFARHSPDSRLKAFNVLSDGNLIVLERSRSGSSKSLVASLRYVDLAACPADGACTAKELAVLPEGRDNFEGMTPIGDQRFLIVSDHSAKERRGTTLMLIAPQ